MNSRKIKIQRATPKDLMILGNIEKQCFSEPWSKKALEDLLLLPDSYVVMAFLDEDYTGYAAYTSVIDEAMICNIAVLPCFRNQGIGKSLMSNLIKQGKSEKLSEFSLEVRVGNKSAIHLYESFGFQKKGIRKHFYRKPLEDAYVYVLSLEEKNDETTSD